MWILIRWLCQNPAGVDLHCFQKKDKIWDQVFSLDRGYQGLTQHNSCQNSKQGRPWSDSASSEKKQSNIGISTKCLGLFSRQLLRPNKEISVFRVTGLKILGRVGTHIFFSRKKYNFMHFERRNLLSKYIKLFFPRKPEKLQCFTTKFR